MQVFWKDHLGKYMFGVQDINSLAYIFYKFLKVLATGRLFRNRQECEVLWKKLGSSHIRIHKAVINKECAQINFLINGIVSKLTVQMER